MTQKVDRCPYCHNTYPHQAPTGCPPVQWPPPDRKAQAEAETGYVMDEFNNEGERIAWDRDEDDYCERGTQGCSVHHTRESDCQTW